MDMLDNLQNSFRVTEPDPDLLSTPFEVQTNWHVITGAPCSGKTTLIDQLANQGFQTVPEAARQYFEQEMASGRTIDEIRENDTALQRGIHDLQLRIERGLDATDILFLDRALPDSLTFYRVFGINPNEILPECFCHRYASVFILDRLPAQRGMTLGPEDDATASFVDEWLARDYSALGYSVVRVPVLSTQERLAFVLETLFDRHSLSAH
jgi:predicted ATPase